jgi:DNA (cytosine-5)-methyltransferase 1
MIKFIDLFAGIGGIRIPFDELGCNCVFASEIDRFAQQTYCANFNHNPHGDITKIDNNSIPEHDILLAGFPCQAFSVAGKRLGFEDVRGTMFFEIARILEHHKPRAFLLENVKGLISHNNGDTLNVILNTLQKLGYNVFYKILNAKDFGIPQNRQRIYLVGFLEYLSFSFPKQHIVNAKLGDILESDVDPKYTLSDRLWHSHQNRKQKHIDNGNGFGYSIFNQDSQYTSTISARYYKDGSEILIEQPNCNPRKLTPREAARLQGFPDSFKIVCSDTQAYKQFGNSVSVPVIRNLAHNIISKLNGDNKEYEQEELLN